MSEIACRLRVGGGCHRRAKYLATGVKPPTCVIFIIMSTLQPGQRLANPPHTRYISLWHEKIPPTRQQIDENSPLYGVTSEMLEEAGTRFMTSIVCTDTVIQAPVQSQADYSWEDAHFDHRFVKICTEYDNGRLEVDYGRVHDIEPVLSKQGLTAAASGGGLG